jgi:membrane protease YdiL (CAAX protease family)
MIPVDLREKLEHMDNRTLYLNLLVTQVALGLIGAILYIFFLREDRTLMELFHLRSVNLNLLYGAIFALAVVLLDLFLMSILPKNYFDDGGVNERLFRDLNAGQIALVALLVSFFEEWLFRGVLQNIIGIFWTSILFAAIHYRYFHKWIYSMLIILISFGFGYLYVVTESLWSVITAHFIIDFCLGLLIRYKWFSFLQDNDKGS